MPAQPPKIRQLVIAMNGERETILALDENGDGWASTKDVGEDVEWLRLPALPAPRPAGSLTIADITRQLSEPE